MGWPAPMPVRTLRPTACAGSVSRKAGARPDILPGIRSSGPIRLPFDSGRVASSAGPFIGTGLVASPAKRGGDIDAADPVRSTRIHGVGMVQVNCADAQLPPKGSTCGRWAQSGSPRKGGAMSGAGSPAAIIASRTRPSAASPLICPAAAICIWPARPSPIQNTRRRCRIITPDPPCQETEPGARQRPQRTVWGQAVTHLWCGPKGSPPLAIQWRHPHRP